MPRKEFDPLNLIPKPELIRERLSQTLALAEKFRILLEVSERLRLADKQPPPSTPDTNKPKGGRSDE